MSRSWQLKLSLVFLLLFVTSCSLPEVPEEDDNSETLGTLAVALDTNKPKVRTQEMPVGNLVADAIQQYAFVKGYEVDFVLINGGNLRFDATLHPTGIYQPGSFTKATAKEILPFQNHAMVVTVTGEELKQIMERSVAELPEAKGNFMQVSRELRVVCDPQRQKQVVNSEGTAIITQGQRILSLKINGTEYNPAGTYRLVTTDFNANGGDSYIIFKDIPANRKIDFGEDMVIGLENYVRTTGTVAPEVDGRIVFRSTP